MLKDILYRLFYSETEHKLYFVYHIGEIYIKCWIWSYNSGRSFLSDREFASKFEFGTDRENDKLMVLSGTDIKKYAGCIYHDLIRDIFVRI